MYKRLATGDKECKCLRHAARKVRSSFSVTQLGQISHVGVESERMGLHATETLLVLDYGNEDKGVTYMDRFVFVKSTHTSYVCFCWTWRSGNCFYLESLVVELMKNQPFW